MSAAAPTIRTSPYIYGLRIFQALFTLILLGICASEASDWQSNDCTTPSRLSYHIAISSLTLFPLLYFLITTYPTKNPNSTSFLSRIYFPFLQLFLDAVFFLFWIIAAGLSIPDCQNICSSCVKAGVNVNDGFDGGYVITLSDGSQCDCEEHSLDRRALVKSIVRATSARLRKTFKTGNSIAAKKGFDAALVFFFFITLAYGAYLKFKSRAPANPQPPQPSGPRGHEEAGLGDSVHIDKVPNAAQGYTDPQGNSQPQDYSQPQGYSQPQDYSPAQGYSQPQDYSHPQGYSQPPDYPHPQGYSQPQEYSPAQGYSQPQTYSQSQGYAQSPGYAQVNSQEMDPRYAPARS